MHDSLGSKCNKRASISNRRDPICALPRNQLIIIEKSINWYKVSRKGEGKKGVEEMGVRFRCPIREDD